MLDETTHQESNMGHSTEDLDVDLLIEASDDNAYFRRVKNGRGEHVAGLRDLMRQVNVRMSKMR